MDHGTGDTYVDAAVELWQSDKDALYVECFFCSSVLPFSFSFTFVKFSLERLKGSQTEAEPASARDSMYSWHLFIIFAIR